MLTFVVTGPRWSKIVEAALSLSESFLSLSESLHVGCPEFSTEVFLVFLGFIICWRWHSFDHSKEVILISVEEASSARHAFSRF